MLHLQYKLGKPGHRRFERRHGRFQPLADEVQILRCADVALVVHAVAPARPAICWISAGFRSRRSTPSNLRVSRNITRQDGEIQPHADGVGRTIIRILPFEKALHRRRRVE